MYQRLIQTIAALSIPGICAGLYAQSSVERPAYVLESLQLSRQSSSGHFINTSTRLDVRSTRLIDLISKAYDTPTLLIFGLDSKVAESRYDILAGYQPKPGEAVNSHELLRGLLAEQFHITAHLESRTVAVYAMTVAPGGVHFSTSAVQSGRIDSDDHSFAGYGVGMRFVATDLSDTMHAIVVDRTALSGRYDLIFTWQPNMDKATNIAIIRQAAEQKLGLVLEPTEAPAESLVVDHVELAQR